MRNKETLRKLAEMHLSGMVELYEEQTRNSDYEDMSFDLELSASSFPIFFHQTVNPCLNKIAFYIHP